jgi:hypothetical protein
VYYGKNYPKNVGYFCIKKLLKANNHSNGENSPNLVTLLRMLGNEKLESISFILGLLLCPFLQAPFNKITIQ